MTRRNPPATVRITKPSARASHPLKWRITGMLCLAWAAFLCISLITYSSADPSPNHITAAPIQNWGGVTGAYLSDIMLQILGLAAILAVLVPAGWGIKRLMRHRLRFLWLRSVMLMSAMVLLAVLLAPIEAAMSWPITSGYGGSIGALLYPGLVKAFSAPITLMAAGACLLLTLPIAFGMSFNEWRWLGGSAQSAISAVIGAVAGAIAWIRGRREEAYEEEGEEEEEEEKEEEMLAHWHEEEEGESRVSRLISAIKNVVFFWRKPEEDEYEGEEEEEENEEEEPLPQPHRRQQRKGPPAVEKTKRAAPVAQSSLALPRGEYELPPIQLLASPPRGKKTGLNESALQQNAKLLEGVLNDFGVQGSITEIRPGPVVTLYELEPAPGTKSSRVIGLSDDIARSMSAISARIAVIPGRNAIGIELPNATRETVYLREMLESEAFETVDAKLPLALGKDIGGAPVITDLARMPHLLVAGTTGSGKSVGINTMIASLVYKLTPDECKFIMIDPKMLELSVYDGIPHLLSPVVTEPGKAVVALKWTVKEMESRYRLMSNLGVRNIDGYNKKIREARSKGKQLTRTVQTGFNPDTGEPVMEEQPLEMNELPYIVVIVDEMADLMIVAGKDIESSVQRLAQMARAAGIHIIMATQRPSVDVITGVIKANFPTRISFQVTSRIDSRTILGEQGAEQLLGQGDMLYMAGGGRITRVHGPFVSDREVEHLVAHLKAQGAPDYIEDVTRDEEDGMLEGGEAEEKDEMYDQAVAIVSRDRKASTSYIQRCLKIGYNRAASIIERMEREGVVSPANHVGKREVLARESA